MRAKTEAALLDPAMGVEASDLQLMAILAGAERADWRIPAVLSSGRAPDHLAERLERRRAEHQTRLKDYAERLARVLPEKRPAAARVSLRAVSAFAPATAEKLARLAQPPVPAVGEWKALPVPEQWAWLATPESWARLDRSAMLPELRRVAARPPDGNDRLNPAPHMLWRTAMKRLHELAPHEAGALLLKQVQDPESPLASEQPKGSKGDFGLDFSLLDLVPPLPAEAQAALASNLEADPVRSAGLVEQLGDVSIYERVEAVYLRRPGEWACAEDWALLGYLIRLRPADGRKLLERAMNLRDRTRCYRFYLSRLAGRLQETDRLALARRYAEDPDPEVARSAARILRRLGPSPD